MKNHKLVAKISATLLSIVLLFSGTETALASSRSPQVTSELFDYRRLDEKFISPDEDYIWSPIDDGLLDIKEKYTVTITADMLDVKPGTVIKQGYTGDTNDSPYDYYISVPEIKQDGKTTDALKDYGVLEAFSYYEVQGANESWRGYAELYLFNKEMLRDHPITINTRTTLDGPYVYAGFPLFASCYSSKDYEDSVSAIEDAPYHADYHSDYFGGTSWYSIKGDAVFTKTSINLPKSELETLLGRAEQCNVLSRETIEEQFATEEDGTLSLNMDGLFNPISGPLGSKFSCQNGYNGYYFITPRSNPGVVIAVRGDEIFIGLSARPYWEDLNDDVRYDKIFVGKYYKDTSDNPEKVSIDRPLPDEPTRNTIDELLRLLLDYGIDWSSVHAGNFDLY